MQNKISYTLHMHLHVKRHTRFAQLRTFSQAVKWLDVRSALLFAVRAIAA